MKKEELIYFCDGCAKHFEIAAKSRVAIGPDKIAFAELDVCPFCKDREIRRVVKKDD